MYQIAEEYPLKKIEEKIRPINYKEVQDKMIKNEYQHPMAECEYQMYMRQNKRYHQIKLK